MKFFLVCLPFGKDRKEVSLMGLHLLMMKRYFVPDGTMFSGDHSKATNILFLTEQSR